MGAPLKQHLKDFVACWETSTSLTEVSVRMRRLGYWEFTPQLALDYATALRGLGASLKVIARSDLPAFVEAATPAVRPAGPTAVGEKFRRLLAETFAPSLEEEMLTFLTKASEKLSAGVWHVEHHWPKLPDAVADELKYHVDLVFADGKANYGCLELKCRECDKDKG